MIRYRPRRTFDAVCADEMHTFAASLVFAAVAAILMHGVSTVRANGTDTFADRGGAVAIVHDHVWKC